MKRAFLTANQLASSLSIDYVFVIFDTLQTCLDGLGSPELALEVALFNKLLYKNTNQHRGTPYFCHLAEVRRLLGLVKELQLPSLITDLLEFLQKARAEQRLLPTHESCTMALRRLQAACHLVEQLIPAIHKASLQLLAQLAHSFFMPFCLACLGALARIRVLSCHLLLGAIKAYNAIVLVAPLLPSTTPQAQLIAGAAAAATQDFHQAAPSALTAQLPQMLRCEWQDGLPTLSSLPFPPGDSLAAQAAVAAVRYGIQLSQQMAALAVLAPVEVPGLPVSRGCVAPGQPQQPCRQASAIDVLEDRGIPISREALGGDGQDGRADSRAEAALMVVEDRGMPFRREPPRAQQGEAVQPVAQNVAATHQAGAPAVVAGLELGSRQRQGGGQPAVQVPALPAVRPPPAFVSVLAGTGAAATARKSKPTPAFISVVAGSCMISPPATASAAPTGRGLPAAVPAAPSAAPAAVAGQQAQQRLQHPRTQEGGTEGTLPVSSAAQPAVNVQQAPSQLMDQPSGTEEGMEDAPPGPLSGAVPLAVGAGAGPSVTPAAPPPPYAGPPLPPQPGFFFHQQPWLQSQLQPSRQAGGPQQQAFGTENPAEDAGQLVEVQHLAHNQERFKTVQQLAGFGGKAPALVSELPSLEAPGTSAGRVESVGQLAAGAALTAGAGARPGDTLPSLASLDSAVPRDVPVPSVGLRSSLAGAEVGYGSVDRASQGGCLSAAAESDRSAAVTPVMSPDRQGPMQQPALLHPAPAAAGAAAASPGVPVSAAGPAAEPARPGADMTAGPAMLGLGDFGMVEAGEEVAPPSLKPQVEVALAVDGGAGNREQQQEQLQKPEQVLALGGKGGAVAADERATSGCGAQGPHPTVAGPAAANCQQQEAAPLLPQPQPQPQRSLPPPQQQQREQEQEQVTEHTLEPTSDLALQDGITVEQPEALPCAVPGVDGGLALELLGAAHVSSEEQQGRVPEGLPFWQPNASDSAPGLTVEQPPAATSASAAATAAEIAQPSDMPRTAPDKQDNPRLQQPAALSLSAGLAGRKRKQPGNTATGLGLHATDEAAAAALPSRSWEDWLSPAPGPGSQAVTTGPGATPGGRGNAAAAAGAEAAVAAAVGRRAAAAAQSREAGGAEAAQQAAVALAAGGGRLCVGAGREEQQRVLAAAAGGGRLGVRVGGAARLAGGVAVEDGTMGSQGAEGEARAAGQG
ncbi:hypothetical protein N2152v2_008507 [Parachlorella kessleri]